MPLSSIAANYFVLEVFDRDQWCPVFQARFEVSDLEALRVALGPQADDDHELRRLYSLDRIELAKVVETFGVAFDPGALWSIQPDIWLHRLRCIDLAPYLVHTGYELPLLLDGRKKLARMVELYPPETFEGEDRFNHWVAEGKLHREEVLLPRDPSAKRYFGHRTVYYALKGEEWRIAAWKMISAAASKTGWNEGFERVEGMLFGYEDWQMDWWMDNWRRRRQQMAAAEGSKG